VSGDGSHKLDWKSPGLAKIEKNPGPIASDTDAVLNLAEPGGEERHEHRPRSARRAPQPGSDVNQWEIIGTATKSPALNGNSCAGPSSLCTHGTLVGSQETALGGLLKASEGIVRSWTAAARC
jgi:hypothetical protein